MYYIGNHCRKLYVVSGYWLLCADFDRGETASCLTVNLLSLSPAE